MTKISKIKVQGVTHEIKDNEAYVKPSGGIPATDLASAVQTSLGLADTALQSHQDISGKADKSEMAISTSGDQTTITLKEGTSTTVLNAHQDISGKVDKVSGKGLSTNDYTTAEKNKLSGIETGAQVNKIEHIQIDGTEQTISNKTVNLPAYPTTLPASDVSAWAKASTKPTYTFDEITSKEEKKAAQEFVYRENPATINAKSLSLDRIYGKTLAWHQFDTQATKTTINEDGQVNGNTNFSVVNGHKYYVAIKIISGGTLKEFRIRDVTEGYIGTTYKSGPVIFTSSFSSNGTTFVQYFINEGVQIITSVINVIDLTLLYGSAISGMTDAEILAKFESEFPGYHEAGNKLISNDAESIETVGFNLWDEEWEIGSYDSQGEKQTTIGNYLIPKNLIPVLPGTAYYSKTSNSAWIREYDANGIYLGVYCSTNTIFTTTNQTYFITFELFGGAPWATYNHDICINLSDPAKNGTYEPYRKSTMQLGLGSFQVRDSQGNVTTITGGLKSAGSVRDEIVGNKYIKRVGEVDLGTLGYNKNTTVIADKTIWESEYIRDRKAGSNNLNCSNYLTHKAPREFLIEHNNAIVTWNETSAKAVAIRDDSKNSFSADDFKSAMSGVMLYYELATPIEYELVSPLVPTVKAGITEARISPNSDGLSAPMVCDATYSVGYEYIEGEINSRIGNIESILATI